MSSSRERIIETAERMVREQGAAAVTMAAVARESDVSRQMVYLHFANRSGLFTAITHHLDGEAKLRERFAEALEREPSVALEEVMRIWLGYLPRILPVDRELYATALTGGEGAEAWAERMDELRRLFRFAARRVELREPWTPETAADWIFTRTHLAVWDALVTGRDWSPGEMVDRTVLATLDELVGA